MKQLRFYYWLLSGFIKKHALVLLLAIGSGVAVSVGILMFGSRLPKLRTAEYVGRVGVYSLATLPRDIQRQVSRGLTSIDTSGKAVSDLAESWQVSEDGLRYEFRLYPDLVWQDGEQLKASDIEIAIADVSITSPDDRTLIFSLSEPFAPFPTIVSQPVFRRKTVTVLPGITRTKIIGAGEYTLADIDQVEGQVRELTLKSGQKKIIYRFFDTEAAAVMSFKLGQVDRLEDLTQPVDISKWNNVSSTTEVGYNRYAAIFFNTQDPNLADKSIRQALTYAIPKKPVDESRAMGPLSRNSWAYNPQIKVYDHSMDSARELLQNKNTDFPLELQTTPAFVRLAEEIASSWTQLGIAVQVRVVSQPDSTQFQALLIGQQIPSDPDQYLLWHSTQPTNLTGYQSAKIDKLLEDGRTLIDEQQRKEVYFDFQRFLVEDSPAAFLFYLPSYTLHRSELFAI